MSLWTLFTMAEEDPTVAEFFKVESPPCPTLARWIDRVRERPSFIA